MSVPPYHSSRYQAVGRVRLDVIGEAWSLFRQQMSAWIVAEFVFVGVLLAGAAACGIVMTIGGLLGGAAAGLAALVVFALVLVMLYLCCGVMAGLHLMAIRQVYGGTLQGMDVLEGRRYGLTLFIATLLTALVVSIGSVFLVIPGLIAAGLLCLTAPLIVHGGRSALDAMAESWNRLKGDMWMALVFELVIGIVSQLGTYLCGVGLLFTLPLFFLSHALVYRDVVLQGGEFGGAP